MIAATPFLKPAGLTVSAATLSKSMVSIPSAVASAMAALIKASAFELSNSSLVKATITATFLGSELGRS